MILIGRLGSPFVRRVAATLHAYGIHFEHADLSTATQAADIAKFNPLVRVPALVLDDGEVLVDSHAIIDHLDELAGADRALTPRGGPERRLVLRLVNLATGAAEMAVAAYYERDRRPKDKVWGEWFDKRAEQCAAAFQALESMRPAPWLALGRMTQADITTVVAFQFTRRVLPELVPEGRYPNLEALSVRLDAEPFFAACKP